MSQIRLSPYLVSNVCLSFQVYQRADLNKMLMSMSVGPYCDLNQDVDSKDWTHGSVVSLVMDENEREFDRCPMYFNDGTDPWNVEENHIRVFNFQDSDSSSSASSTTRFVITALFAQCSFVLLTSSIYLAKSSTPTLQ